MSDRLFDVDDIPEVPLFRAPHRRARGIEDARFSNDYPPDWHRCTICDGEGYARRLVQRGEELVPEVVSCLPCLGMGSLKARVRLEAGHRCVRCQHPYIPKGDAKMLGVEPSGGRWSRCDARCSHEGNLRTRQPGSDEWLEWLPEPFHTDTAGVLVDRGGLQVEAEWRILTVHHLDGDKANCAWWNLAALCQRCHLHIQHKVIMERVWPHEHTAWFRPYVAGYYAHVYLGQNLARPEVEARLDELLALERGDA